MKGQAAEYVMVFAAVVAMAIIVVALAFKEFPYVLFDAQAVVFAQDAGYNAMLLTFSDGRIGEFHTDYNAQAKEVTVRMTVLGWNDASIKSAIQTAMSNYGYTVKWS